MTQPSNPHDDVSRSAPQVNVSGGQIAGGNVVAGNQTNVGGDQVQGNKIIGFSENFAIRLALIVGALVFFTAACFFSGGVIVGFAALNALDKQVGSSIPEAQTMQRKLEQVNALRPNQPFNLSFTEDEISSYIKFIEGPKMGLNNAKVRLLENNQLIVSGDWQQLNGLPIAATFALTNGDPALRLESAAVRVVSMPNSSFGWVAVPSAVAQPAATQVNDKLFKNARITSARATTISGNIVWTVNGVRR